MPCQQTKNSFSPVPIVQSAHQTTSKVVFRPEDI